MPIAPPVNVNDLLNVSFIFFLFVFKALSQKSNLLFFLLNVHIDNDLHFDFLFFRKDDFEIHPIQICIYFSVSPFLSPYIDCICKK